MADSQRPLREEVAAALRAATAELSTSSLGRLRHAATAALRTALLARRSRGGGGAAPEVEALVSAVRPLGQLKGLGMKLGQLMSYLELQLPPDLQAALSVLQTQSPAMPFERVVALIEEELGECAAPLLTHMRAEHVAAASIGQVHRAELPGGTQVAVKVQYPDIERTIATDFRSATLGTGMAALLMPGAEVEGVLAEVRRALLEECDYGREADYQERFARLYQTHPTLSVPPVHRAYCSRRVLTTTWAEGVDLEALLSANPSQRDRDRFGTALFEFYVGGLYRYGLYNWDPHPGNYLFAPDGRLSILDHGAVREFPRQTVRALATLSRAAQTDTYEALDRAFLGLGLVRAGKRYDFDATRSLVRSFYGPLLRDEVLGIEPAEARPFQSVLASKRKLLALDFPPLLLFVLRIRFGLMSVLSRLGARANWYQIERELANDALRDDARAAGQDGSSYASGEPSD